MFPVSKTGQQNNTKVKCSPVSKTGQQNGTKGPETGRQQNDTRGKYCTFINEPGFYELVFGSKLEFAKKFRQLFHLFVNMANTKCLIVPGIR